VGELVVWLVVGVALGFPGVTIGGAVVGLLDMGEEVVGAPVGNELVAVEDVSIVGPTIEVGLAVFGEALGLPGSTVGGSLKGKEVVELGRPACSGNKAVPIASVSVEPAAAVGEGVCCDTADKDSVPGTTVEVGSLVGAFVLDCSSGLLSGNLLLCLCVGALVGSCGGGPSVGLLIISVVPAFILVSATILSGYFGSRMDP
jgi:hypothetical protein